MADEKHLRILKQGVNAWNRWRENNRRIRPDLRHVDFRGTDFRSMDPTGVNLRDTDLCSANLCNTNLSKADLYGADLSRADLNKADLSGASLIRANLSKANLHEASLHGAILYDAILHNVNVCDTVFNGANFGATTVSDTDLSKAIQIETIEHQGPSSIDTGILRKSRGQLPENFLRGCGLSDMEIAFAKLYDPNLSIEETTTLLYRIIDLRASRPLQISPIFISYSHADAAFVDHLEGKLNASGIRFWRDIHDATSGRLEKQVDRAIRHNPTVLLILSENSTDSDWVEWEVTKARKLEKETDRDVLCPIALDDSWKTCQWPERIMNQIMDYNILDFSNWLNDEGMDKMFIRLLKGLELYYQK